MAVKNKTARPAARKQSHTKTKKTVAARTASRSAGRHDPIAQVVDRAHPRPPAEPPKLKGELPVPTATFYF
jgi:hypothetical protein